jgi:hypothetical protein
MMNEWTIPKTSGSLRIHQNQVKDTNADCPQSRFPSSSLEESRKKVSEQEEDCVLLITYYFEK